MKTNDTQVTNTTHIKILHVAKAKILLFFISLLELRKKIKHVIIFSNSFLIIVALIFCIYVHLSVLLF